MTRHTQKGLPEDPSLLILVILVEPTTGIEPVNLFLTKEVLYLLSYVGLYFSKKYSISEMSPLFPKSPRSCCWSGKRDSNPRRSAWKADALPTELFPRPEHM